MKKETIKLNLYVWGLYLLTLGYFASLGFYPKDYIFLNVNIFPVYLLVFIFISVFGSFLIETKEEE